MRSRPPRGDAREEETTTRLRWRRFVLLVASHAAMAWLLRRPRRRRRLKERLRQRLLLRRGNAVRVALQLRHVVLQVEVPVRVAVLEQRVLLEERPLALDEVVMAFENALPVTSAWTLDDSNGLRSDCRVMLTNTAGRQEHSFVGLPA